LYISHLKFGGLTSPGASLVHTPSLYISGALGASSIYLIAWVCVCAAETDCASLVAGVFESWSTLKWCAHNEIVQPTCSYMEHNAMGCTYTYTHTYMYTHVH
jgi:hypothetical protein